MWSINDGFALKPLGTFKNPPDDYQNRITQMNNLNNKQSENQHDGFPESLGGYLASPLITQTVHFFIKLD